jgi:hypothetical protein
MNTPRISRRSVVLGSALALPVLSLVRASDPKTPLTPQRRQYLVLETRREAAPAGSYFLCKCAAWTYVAAAVSAIGTWLFYVVLLLSQARSVSRR